MKSQIIMAFMITALGLSAFAQSTDVGEPKNTELQIGVGEAHFQNTKANAFVVTGDLYLTRAGQDPESMFSAWVIPVSVTLSNKVQMYTAGVGVTTFRDNQFLNHNINLAVAEIIRNDPNVIDPSNVQRLTLLLQNKISMNLSKRLNLNVTVNLDVLNGSRNKKLDELNHFDKNTEPDRYDLRRKSIIYDFKAGSGTGGTIGLSLRLGK